MNLIQVYKLTFPNNKVYIGRCNAFDRNGKPWGAKKRLQIHKGASKHSSSKISEAIKLFKEKSIDIEVLVQVDDVQIANKYEQDFIDLYDSTNEQYGYNTFSGGNSLHRLPESTRQKQSRSRKKQMRQPLKQETKNEISNTRLEAERFNHRGEVLPKYLGLRNAKDRCGYRISEYHPLFKDSKQHSFVTSEYTKTSVKDEKFYEIMDEKYKLCFEELNKLNRMMTKNT